MNWTTWIVCEHDGVDCFTPVEPGDLPGEVNVVRGMAVFTSLDEMRKRAKRIIRVDDEYTLANDRLEWEADDVTTTWAGT